MYHSFLIHSSADGHLGWFHVLAIINSAVINTGVHVSLSILVSMVYMPSSGIAGYMTVLFAVFLRNWRRLLRVPWTARRSNQSILKEINQSWIFAGRTDAKDETPILWPPDVKNWLIWKDPDAGKDWRWEEKGMTEDEMVRWHHQLDGHEFE